jgi:hypothetical protein
MAKTEAAVPKPEVAPQRDLALAEPEATPPAGLVEATPLSVVDEFKGQGGSYLLDPATGIRTLVERTKSASL